MVYAQPENKAKNTAFSCDKMNSKVYKWCAVPKCPNTSTKTPNKLFVYVPNKKIIRNKWLKLAQRNPNEVCINSPLYFCEDHFDLPNDMENYMQYHVMGSVSQVRMKPGCMPKKCIYQPDSKTQTERSYKAKKQRTMTRKKCEQKFKEKSIGTEQSSCEEIASGCSVVTGSSLMARGSSDLGLELVKEEPPDQQWIEIEVDIEEHELLQHPRVRAALPHLAPAESQLLPAESSSLGTEALRDTRQAAPETDIKLEPESGDGGNEGTVTEEDALVASSLSNTRTVFVDNGAAVRPQPQSQNLGPDNDAKVRDHYALEYPGGRNRRNRKCVVCRKRVHTYCAGCDEAVCVIPCFRELHVAPSSSRPEAQ